MSQTPLYFKQATELGGAAIVNTTDKQVQVSLEFDDHDGMTHILQVSVVAQGHYTLPQAKEYRLVHKTSRKTILSFVPWSFSLVTHTHEGEFVIKYVSGPDERNVRVRFVPAKTVGLRTVYEEPVEVEGPEEWNHGRSYTLVPSISSSCMQGKFVIESEDGLKQSMIPWVSPSLKNPTYAMSQLVGPLAMESLMAVLLHKTRETMMPQEETRSTSSVVMQTLLTSLVAMHGPLMIREMGRGISPTASQLLARPGDSQSTDGLKRLVKSADVWQRILSAVVGTQMMSGAKK